MKSAKLSSAMNLRISSLCAVYAFAFSAYIQCLAQETIAPLSQVLPFANQGGVTITEKAVDPQEEVKSPSNSAQVSNKSPRKVSVAQAGSVIKTSSGPTSLVLGFEGTARMEASSEIKIPDGPSAGSSLELLKGSLFLNISGEALAKRGAGEFRLKTPAALLAVKGTQFFSISNKGADIIGVHEGSVLVTDSKTGKIIQVEGGNAVDIAEGALGSVRPMSPKELDLKRQHELATYRVVPLPPVVHLKQPSLRTMTYREGRVVSTSQPALSFRNLDAHLWWQHYGDPAVGVLDVTPEGHVRFVWNQPNNNARNEGAQYVAETTVLLCLRGRKLERFSKDASAPPLLKAMAIRFRFRLDNVENLKLASMDSHSYATQGGEGKFQALAEHKPGASQGTTAGAFSTHIIPAKAGGDWQEALVPVVHRSYVQREQGADANDFASDDILFRWSVRIADPSSKAPNKEASKVEMKDFELLTLP